MAESDTRILPVAIGDGVTWSGDGPKLHQSVCSGVTLRDRDFYSPAEQSEDAILKAAQASAGRLNAGFLSLPRFLETTLRIYVLDLHKTLIFSLREDIEWDDFIGESTSDISTHSGSLHAWFASAYGTDGFDVGAHYRKWGIHLTQVAPRRCGLVDPWTPAHCTQNAPWGARRRSAGNWATRLRFGPIKDYARAMAIAGLETWCYRQAFPGAANGQPQYVVVT